MSAINNRILPRRNALAAAENDHSVRNKYLFVFFFLAPGMALFFAFFLMPVSNSVRYSLYDWNGFGPPTDYVELDNYDRLVHNEVFQNSIKHSLQIVALSLIIQLPLALGLAIMVGRGHLPGKHIFRTILFVPYVFSEILTAYIWAYVYHPRDGLVNWAAGNIIPNYETIPFLADRGIVMFAIFAVITWKYFGLHMILYMAALQGVPEDLEDAARLDGASEAKVLQKVTIPLIGPTIRLTVYLSVLGSFQQFVMIWILTEGGPANASQVIATYLYKFGIISLKLGFGSAVAIILVVITLSFSLFYQFFVMRQDYSQVN
jgi:raffinose/stachyose/melibiose transport system permease protein